MSELENVNTLDEISTDEINIEDVNIEDLMTREQLPPLPEMEGGEGGEEVSTAELLEDTEGNPQNYGDDIDWDSLEPVDQDGFRNPSEADYDSLTPYNAFEKPATIWDEFALKKDMGSFTRYRAQLARDVMTGKISFEEAQGLSAERFKDTLNKYGVTKAPEFSFSAFKKNPFRTMFGEAAQLLPFYWGGIKKGAAASVATTPVAVGKNIMFGGTGVVKGVIEGVSTGMLMGTFLESMDVEGGNLYMDLREKGITHETALKYSLAGGVLNGLLETVSFGVLTAPVKGAAKKVAADTIYKQLSNNTALQKAFTNTVSKVLLEYGKRTGTEVATEMAQDVTNIVMTMLSAQADSVDNAMPDKKDWVNILKQTGPKALAASLVMSAIGIPFDVMGMNTGAEVEGTTVENNARENVSEGEIVENAEGKQVGAEGFLLEGHVLYDSTENQDNIGELEAELEESRENAKNSKKEVEKLQKREKSGGLTQDEQADLEYHRKNIEYEEGYQKLILEELNKNSEKINENKEKQSRKQELTQKGKKEKLSAKELEELNDLWIEEEKTKGENEINENTNKAQKRKLDKDIRDIDKKIDKAQKQEDVSRKKRNEIENQQDKNNQKISELEKENKEIERALKETDTEEDAAEMNATVKKNLEQIKDLKNNNKFLEKQRGELNKKIEEAILQQEEFATSRDILDKERAQLLEGVFENEGNEENGNNAKVDISLKNFKNMQLSALKSKLKAMKQGIKRGVRLARREIRDAQNSAVNLIKKSDMDDKDKARLLATIKNIDSSEKFEKVLPQLLDKISDMEEKHNKNQLINFINKLLKKAKPKKGGKTPVGKFNADIQKILDDIVYAAKLTENQVNSEIEQIFDNAKNRDLTDEEIQKVRILNDFGGMKQKTSSDLLKNARAINMLIEDGKIAGQFREQAKKEHREKIIKEAQESIVGSVEPTGNKKKDKAAFINSIKQAFRSFGAMSETWEGLMTIASLHDKNKKLVKLLDVFSAKMNRIKGEMDAFNRFAGLAMKALECKTFKQFAKKVKEDTKVIDVGVYTDINGNKVTLQASRAQARKLYMEMLRPELEEQLRNNNGYTFKTDIEDKNVKAKEPFNSPLDVLYGDKSNKSNDDLNFSIVDKSTQQLLEDFLTPEDLDFIQVQLDFYKEYRKRLNPYYRDKYGIDMPDSEFYSPIARELDGSDRREDWINTSAYQKSLTPSNFRSRRDNNKKIILQNDIDVMQNHIAESEHFIAFDGFMSDARAIFGNPEIRNIIQDKYGEKFLRLIDGHLKDIAADGVEAIRPEMGFFAKVRNLFTGAALGARAKIFFTQLTAIGVFSDAIPSIDFAKGLVDFTLHPIEATKILSESYLLKDRQNSINMEIRDIVRSQEYQAITRYKDLRNKMFFFTQLGDKWSIIGGGWSVYKYTLEKTGDKTKAMEAFERAVNKYQQSGHIDNLSSWQRGNPMQKAMVMFMSDQMRQMQAEVRAVKEAIINKDSKSIAQAAKTVAIMHFVLPNLVQFVANGFAWDDVDQLKASILGPFTSIAILGQVLSMGASLALKYYGAKIEDERFKDIDIFESLDVNVFGPLNRLREDISKYINKMYKGDVEREDFCELWANVSKNFIGQYAGMPIKFGFDLWEKTPEYLEDGDFWSLIKLWSGVSPYTIENKGKNKED